VNAAHNAHPIFRNGHLKEKYSFEELSISKVRTNRVNPKKLPTTSYEKPLQKLLLIIVLPSSSLAARHL
jgi:hypothetical protein